MFEEKENLLNSWRILNSSNSNNESRKNANVTLMEFKVKYKKIILIFFKNIINNIEY